MDDEQLVFKVSTELRAEFEKQLRAGDQFKTKTAFLTACVNAYIVCVRNKARPLLPLEFVTESALVAPV